MGAGPLSAPTGSPGQSANALSKVREAIKILIEALPELPMGSEPWKATNAAIQNLGKHVSPSDEVPGVQQTQLRGLQQSAGKDAALQSLMRSMGGGGAAAPGAAPGGAPPPPM